MSFFRSFPLLLIFLLSSVSFSMAAAPALKTGHKTFDFGEVMQGDTVSHTFTFENSGDAPLLIDRVKSSCGCTAALLSSKTIAPGEKGTIKATFDSTRFRGSIQKTIYLYSNVPGFNKTLFNLKGVVKPWVEYKPGQLDFGEVREGETGELKLILKNAGEKIIKIEHIRAVNTALSATTLAKELLPGVETEFRAFARPVKETRNLKGYILVRTDSATLGEMRIPVRGVIVRE